MTMARYSGVVQDDAGNIITNAKVEVRREVSGQPLAALKSDRAGVSAITNPFDAEADGTFFFHVVGGDYQVRVYTGPSGAPTFERILRYVSVGLLAGRDLGTSPDPNIAYAWQLGMRGDGTTDNSAIFQGWVDGLPAQGGKILFGPGSFVFSQPCQVEIPNPAGWSAQSTTSLTVGTGAKAFTVESGLTIPTGSTATAYALDAFGVAVEMVGTVSSYAGTTLTLSIASVTGSGTISGWDIVQNYLARDFISSVSIEGAGSDLTELKFPDTNGLIVTYQSQQHSFHLRGVSVTTGSTDPGSERVGILLTNNYPFFGTFVAQSDIRDVTIRGGDGYAKDFFWGYGVLISNVSDVNFDNLNIYGDGSGGSGTGIDFTSPGAGSFSSPTTTGTVYNITNSNFSFLGVGIRYGENTQTLQVANSFFAQVTTGILVPASAGTLQGLNVTNTTFFVIGSALVGLSSVPNLIFKGNMVTAGPSVYAIDVLNSNATISGNQFIPRGAPNTASGGIKVSSASSADHAGIMNIDDNTFSSVGQAIFLNNATTNPGVVSVGPMNKFTGNSGDILNNQATNKVYPGSSSQVSVGNPTATSSLGGVMAGLSQSFTPSWSGRVLVNFGGFHTNSTAADGVQTQIRYGTGTPPANGAALTGTAVGAARTSVAGLALVPFMNMAIITGLAIGTTYWIDLSQAAVTGGSATIGGLGFTAVEV